jgi:hypothetical protein
MSVAWEIVIAVIVVLVALGVTLRLRKLRRDEMRKIAARVDRRLMVPPPSPYTPSKGFRLLDGPTNSAARPEPPRPRLEPDRDYVFSESQLPSYQEGASPLGRHDERWALSKSVRGTSFSTAGARVALLAIVVVVIAIVGFYYAEHGNTPSAPSTTTTTTLASSTQSNSKVAWPSTLVASLVNGENASYRVPAAKYRVTVSGTNGAVWTVYRMGPQNTLEWQGKINQGSSESLVLSGVSQITLGSPRSATVRVGLSAVAFPSVLPPTLTLILRPPAIGSG